MFNRRVPDVLDWQTWRRQLNIWVLIATLPSNALLMYFTLLKYPNAVY